MTPGEIRGSFCLARLARAIGLRACFTPTTMNDGIGNCSAAAMRSNGLTRDARFDAAEHGPPTAIRHGLQRDPQVGQRLASENSVVIGLDEPIVRSLQAIPQQRDRFCVESHEVFVNAGLAEPITATQK